MYVSWTSLLETENHKKQQVCHRTSTQDTLSTGRNIIEDEERLDSGDKCLSPEKDANK